MSVLKANIKRDRSVPFFVVCLALLLSLPLSAQKVEYNQNMQQAFDDLFSLKIDRFQAALKNERRNNPQNKAADYLEAAYLFINMFVNEDEVYFTKQKARLDELQTSISELDKSNPYRLLYLGELKLATATLEGKFGNRLKAAFQFYSAHNTLKENYTKYPDFVLNYIPMGVLYAAIGSLPQDYQNMAGVIGIEGDISEGVSLIKKGYWYCLSEDSLRFHKDFNGFIYSYISHQLGTGNISPESLSLDFKSNLFLGYMQVLIWNSEGKVKPAVELLEKQLNSIQGIEIPYLHYMLGKIALPVAPETSLKALNKYLALNKTGNYKKSTYRYLAWYYLLKDDAAQVEVYRKKVLNEGEHSLGADKQALREAREGWLKPLVQARLYFDGALYQKGLDVLNAMKIDDLNANQTSEYYYRKGRCLQEMNQKTAAISAFKAAVSVEGAESTYALGNSALQLALLYESKKQYEQASVYFKKTLEISGYPFYEGVHQKAKTGLDRIKG